MKKALLVLMVLVMAMALLAGCGGGTTDEGTTPDEGTATTGGEKIVRISVSGTPVLDPYASVSYSSTQATINLYEALVFPDGENVKGLLADSWEENADGTEYTFTLKQGVKFHSGNEVKASDVVFSVNRILTMGEGFAYLYNGVIKDVTAVDDYTVKFTLDHSFGPFVASLIRLAIMDEKTVMANIADGAYGEFGDYGRNWLLTNDAGSGPYMAKELVQQGYLYAVKFDGWHGTWEADAPDSFKFIDNTEATTIRTMMANKELEITDPWQSTENLNAMSKLDGVKIAAYSNKLTQYMHFNTKLAPTDDVNYRKALSCLIDYDMLINNIFVGSTKCAGPVNAGTAGHVQTTQYTYDLEKAKEYLAQSKYASNYQDYPIEMLVNSDVQDLEKVALAFQAAAQQVGIQVEITKAPWITIQERISTPESTPNLVSINAGPNYNEAGATLEATSHSKTTGTYENVDWLLDKDLDAQIEDALATPDQTERFQKYADLQNYIVDELCPAAYLADLAERVAYQTGYFEWPAGENGMSGLMGYHYYVPDMKIFPDKK